MGANIASLVIDGYRIGGYFERIGMEDADLEDKFDHLETALESFEALGDLLVINEEAPSLEQFEPFLEGLGVSLEDIKTIEANNSWDIVWKRIKQIYATSLIGRFDMLYDTIASSRKALEKYEKRVNESEKLIKGKEVDLKNTEFRGTLIELVNTFSNGLGIHRDINGSISEDIEMVKFVLIDYTKVNIEQTRKATDEIVKGKSPKDSDYKHPVELFPKKYLKEGHPYLRHTGFVIKGNWDPSVKGWARLAQKGTVRLHTGAAVKVMNFQRFIGAAEEAGVGYPNDLKFTVKDIHKTIAQFREYLKILKDFEAEIKRSKASFKHLEKTLKNDTNVNASDVAAFVKVSARTLKYPTAQTLRRSVPVIRNIGYLINRMAKVAK